MVQMTQKSDGVYADAQEELKRVGQDDAAGRRVDKALEDARGKDTVRLHVALHATDLADARASERHDAIVRISDKNQKSIVTRVEEAQAAILDDAAEAYNETIDLAESNHSAVVELVTKSKAEVARDLKGAREDLLNGQAVLGEAVTSSRKAAETDGQAIMNLLREQHEAQIALVQTMYDDLDTKLKHFREEMSNDVEKMATTVGNQSASVRGDMSVVLSLLSDVRKDQIGRPERR